MIDSVSRSAKCSVFLKHFYGMVSAAEKALVLLALGLWLMSSANVAQSKESSPSERQFQAWLAAFNEGSQTKLQEFARKNKADQTVHVADDKVILPYDNQLLGAEGFPIYVSDATISSKIPWLENAGARLSYCINSMTVPQIFTVVYSPTVTGPHRATTNFLSCTHERHDDQFICEKNPVHAEAYFDVDPDHYFQLADDTPEAEVLPLIKAVMTRDLKFAKGIEDPNLANQKGLVGTILHLNGKYTIRYGDCGCSGTMQLAPQRSSASYLVMKASIDMCI